MSGTVQARQTTAAARNPLSWGVSAWDGRPDVSIDPNGNLTQKVEGGVTWIYAWDAENRLKWVCNTTPCTQGAAVASFQYDALGRRVEKVAGSVTTTYTYDGEDILRQIAGASTLKYLHAPGIDEPLAQEDGAGALSYFHADGLGSIVKTTSSAGAVTSTRRYDAFGNFELGAANGYAFTGREWDTETGLYYYRARYYDPKIGRFIGDDPVRWAGGINLYVYVKNSPVGLVDPFGLQSADLKSFHDGLPPPPPRQSTTPDNCLDAFSFMGAMGVLVLNGDIRDKVGHCQAHCEIVKRCGSIGKVVSHYVGYEKEHFDAHWKDFWSPRSPGWDPSDIKANDWGASCPANTSCLDRCQNAQTQFP